MDLEGSDSKPKRRNHKRDRTVMSRNRFYGVVAFVGCSILLYMVADAIINAKLTPRPVVPVDLNELKTALFQNEVNGLRNVTSDRRRVITICPGLNEEGIDTRLGGQILCQASNKTSRHVFLTLFTTITNRKAKLPAFNRTLTLWPLLGKDVRLLLYVAPSSEKKSDDYVLHMRKIIKQACSLNWDVLIAPKCNKFNYPVVSSMFLTSQSLYNSTWYGYSNADILFSEDLLQTLHFLERRRNPRIDFVVGRRYNVQIRDKRTISSLQEIGLLIRNASFHVTCAEDYFFARKDSFPWTKVPPFVVGRPGFDNWLVWKSHTANIPTVDASHTISALHQSIKGVRSDHVSVRIDDDNYNARMLHPWNPILGHTNCLRYLTNYSSTGEPLLLKRHFVNERRCYKLNRTEVLNDESNVS